ncbi:type VI secretion protein IcmF/TssM N-terminal domain-containing protein [Roseiconus lacunae]|uniref:type VI secretion protein IcmF/TssM N-terminal domain-containing protein n=1 Tax=Roseiconus lacunae TaxID=2605694 RepID=UPI00308D1D10|nr:type VI secretion protein IcmF/TssM N-terminal domain-containing protein [Stieleria sp. HD01]
MGSAIRSFIDAVLYPFRLMARIPSSVISTPRRVLGLSLQSRAALLLWVGLLFVAIIWAVVRFYTDDREQFGGFLAMELPIVLLLCFAIPAVVWYALKLWLEGEPSQFPEIDRVWDGALESMREHSIDPTETPIFMILGPGTVDSVNAFMATSNTQFPVRTPLGPAPIHVFANQQAIYVVCTECCQLSKLFGSPRDATIVPDQLPGAPPPPFAPNATMDVSSMGGGQAFGGPPIPPAAANPGGNYSAEVRNTIAGLNIPTPAPSGGADLRGTMMVGDLSGGAANPTAPQGGGIASAALTPSDASEATNRLAHLARLFRKLRDPLCPINGVIVSTPFRFLADGSQEMVNQILVAQKADLACLRGTLRIRCSVTHVVDSMELETGFRELVRRVGAERSSVQRFGKGYGLWNLPNAQQLDAVVRHACGAFEDWSYLLFREGDGLNKAGNRHLYSLLCRIRSTFQPRLSHLIKSAYGINPSGPQLSDSEPLLFSGCYFVASGQMPDRQAFLASVFKKAQNEEEELEWGSEAIAEEDRMQAGVRVLMVVNGALVATIIGLLVYHFNVNP